MDPLKLKLSLPRVFDNLLLCVVSKSGPSPHLRKDGLLVDHTLVYRIIFNNEATDWCFFIVVIS
jgi:hypothetical protein